MEKHPADALSMIRAYYRALPQRLAAARNRVARPLTLAEKILFAHWEDRGQGLPERGTTTAALWPDRVAMQDATAQMAILQFMTAGRENLEAVEEFDWNGRPNETGGIFGPSGEWDVEPVDLVLTFRNYHNFSPEDRMAVNDSVYDVLKPGGYYGIVDHTRRHMQPGSRENGRRVDPVLNIKEVEQAGFIFVDFTDVLARPQDELVYEVGNPEVSGQTDRYTLLFQKPE